MDFFFEQIAKHGYPVLWTVVFLEAIGLPCPAAIALLVSGAAAARHVLDPRLALGGAIGVMMIADTLMFLMGRYTGWWLLGILCRLSLNPESCILRSADTFYRRGRLFLLFAKFLPGINTLAPPLAGSMNMSAFSFLRLDMVGTALYTGTFFGAGYLFSGALERVANGYESFGMVLGILLAIAALGYLGLFVRTWLKSRALLRVPVVEPAEAARIVALAEAVIYDVRSHGYYDAKATRIQGSQRLDPNALHQSQPQFPAGQTIYLYCTCVGAATSARVARELIDQGIPACVIQGGLSKWRKQGLPVEVVPEGEVTPLPSFA